MRIRCKTKFDCSATGVTGHFRSSQIPFLDRAGQHIRQQSDWNRSRNQPRNWETLLQIVSLRCPPENIAEPRKNSEDLWTFEFDVELAGLFDHDDFSSLLQDCEAVPMLIGLDEGVVPQPLLKTSGPDCNIWFETVNI